MQPFLRLHALGKLTPRLVLPQARAQCRRRRAAQRFRVERALQHHNVAQQLKPVQRMFRASIGTFGGEQDQRKIGPRRLLAEPLEELRHAAVGECFFRDQRRARAAAQLGVQHGGVEAGETVAAVLAQHFTYHVRVAAAWGKDQDTVFHGSAALALGLPSMAVSPRYAGKPASTPSKSRSASLSSRPPRVSLNWRIVRSSALPRLLTAESAVNTSPRCSK